MLLSAEEPELAPGLELGVEADEPLLVPELGLELDDVDGDGEGDEEEASGMTTDISILSTDSERLQILNIQNHTTVFSLVKAMSTVCLPSFMVAGKLYCFQSPLTDFVSSTLPSSVTCMVGSPKQFLPLAVTRNSSAGPACVMLAVPVALPVSFTAAPSEAAASLTCA